MTELPGHRQARQEHPGVPAADLAGAVTAALEPSIRPSIIARGAALRVVGVDDRVVTLEVTGSPGAVLPVAARVEAQIRAAVPGVTAVRFVTPAAQPPGAQPLDARPPGAQLPGVQPSGTQPSAAQPPDAQPSYAQPPGAQPPSAPPDAQPPTAQPPEAAAPGTMAEQARRILDTEVNPAIAAHRGRVVLTGADDGWVRIRLEGGCQGCSLAEVTVRQGIEPLLRARLPGLVGVADVTDHEAGTQPFFSPEKR
jgi:Fe-S cluster biogenesis protein NfuA